MQNIIETLYDTHVKSSPNCDSDYTAALHRVSSNQGTLKKDFSKYQKRLLLHIIDDKDLICEIETHRHFTEGFRLGMHLMCEMFCK